jgi:hypothetical protein
MACPRSRILVCRYVNTFAMTEKLTLSVPPKFKQKAAMLSRKRKKSISALFVEFVEREAKREKDPFANLDGAWEGRDITLESLREKAWKRS